MRTRSAPRLTKTWRHGRGGGGGGGGNRRKKEKRRGGAGEVKIDRERYRRVDLGRPRKERD